VDVYIPFLDYRCLSSDAPAGLFVLGAEHHAECVRQGVSGHAVGEVERHEGLPGRRPVAHGSVANGLAWRSQV